MSNFLTRGIEDIIEKKSLEEKLKSGKKLRIKLGVDATAPDIHLGIAVPLRKLAEFQKMGHQAIFLIGDFTTMIGDPSGVNKTRPMLTEDEVEKNAKTYLAQAGKILDVKKAEIRKNSEWFSKMKVAEFLKIKSYFTLQRILERDDFEKRIKGGTDIRAHEIDYPIVQAYDSVILKTDIEIGGSDQKFNFMAARKLMEKMGLPAQDIITFKLLVGTDGIRKMSKSFGNYVGITEKPEEMFGKLMSIPDNLIGDYVELCTDLDLVKIRQLKNPRDQKARLAFDIVYLYHGKEKAQEAEEEFERVFKRKEMPSKIEEVYLNGNWHIVDLIMNLKMAPSRSEAVRLIEQGAVRINEKPVFDRRVTFELEDGMIVQAGKRKFVRIKVKKR